MIKSPITKNGDIRFIELIKFSVLIWFFYALISSVIVSNYQVIIICSSTIVSISIVLGVLNVMLLSLSVFDVIKEYTDKKLFVVLSKTYTICLESIKETIVTLKETIIVIDIQKSNMVVRC